jgi:hypothetical protein
MTAPRWPCVPAGPAAAPAGSPTLLPAAVTERRADTTAVIVALLASARGTDTGDRRPARPAAVHGAALDPRDRDPAHVERLRAQAID